MVVKSNLLEQIKRRAQEKGNKSKESKESKGKRKSELT
jgi:hypothetical protein